MKEERYTKSKDGEILYDNIRVIKDPVQRLNELEAFRQSKNNEISKLRKIIDLQSDIIYGLKSYLILKHKYDIDDYLND